MFVSLCKKIFVAVGLLLQGWIYIWDLIISINKTQKELDLQLRTALENGDEAKTLRLLRRLANPNKPDNAGYSSLRHSVLRGHFNLIPQLIKYGADIEQEGVLYGYKPLHSIISSLNKVGCLNELVKSNVDIKSTDSMGNNLLQLMVKGSPNDVGFIKRLILLGLDVNTVGLIGNNCLHNSASCHFCEDENAKILTEMFLKQGININSKNMTTLETPLHTACRRGKSYLVEILLRAGAALDAMDNNGRTALENVCISEPSAILVSRIFMKHLVLRMRRGESVNQTLIQKIESNMEMRKLHDEFVDDSNRLKYEISPSYRVSYHEILCRGHRSVVKCMRNIEIRNGVIGCLNALSTSYKKEIELRVEGVMELMKRQETTYEVVDKICEKRLPHLCVEKLSSYLSLEDLQGCSFMLDENH